MGKSRKCKDNNCRHLFRTSTFLLICLAFLSLNSTTLNQTSQLQISHWNYETLSTRSSEIINHNFVAKLTYGNRRSNGIKICQWNAGGGYLSTKQPELHNIVAGYKSQVLGITESGFKKSHDKEDFAIQDYNLYFANTLDNPNLAISRACVYVHKDLKVKVRNDLMSDSFSSVWLELGKPRQKKILVCVLYREWQHVNQPDDSSRSITSQLERWSGFLDQWETAIFNREGDYSDWCDVNLNFLKWCDEKISTSSQKYKHLREQ